MMRQEVIPYTTVSPFCGTNCSEDVDSTNVGQLEDTVSGVCLKTHLSVVLTALKT